MREVFHIVQAKLSTIEWRRFFSARKGERASPQPFHFQPLLAYLTGISAPF
jgi:hypothetical protein